MGSGFGFGWVLFFHKAGDDFAGLMQALKGVSFARRDVFDHASPYLRSLGYFTRLTPDANDENISVIPKVG